MGHIAQHEPARRVLFFFEAVEDGTMKAVEWRGKRRAERGGRDSTSCCGDKNESGKKRKRKKEDLCDLNHFSRLSYIPGVYRRKE